MQVCTAKWSFLCPSLWPNSHNENFQKLITEKPSSSHCHYRQRGDRPADSLGSCREPGSDTLSHSPALIVQKMWFVLQLHFLGKVVFTVGGVPVTWIALLFSHTGTFEYVCACVAVSKCVCQSLCISANRISRKWLTVQICIRATIRTLSTCNYWSFPHNSVSQTFLLLELKGREPSFREVLLSTRFKT